MKSSQYFTISTLIFSLTANLAITSYAEDDAFKAILQKRKKQTPEQTQAKTATEEKSEESIKPVVRKKKKRNLKPKKSKLPLHQMEHLRPMRAEKNLEPNLFSRSKIIVMS